MIESIKKGVSFGLASGIITTLGLIVGLASGTHQKSVVIGGILIIAIADSLSDAFGIHISEEAENAHTHREVWGATLATFIAKLFFALSFIIPIVYLELSAALAVSVLWGLAMISGVSIFLARAQKKRISKVVFEHLSIAVVVIILTHFVGKFISSFFN